MSADAPRLHLLCGPTGAGKTTHGRRLAAELPGVLLTIDDWMAALFWPDRAADTSDAGWAMQRVARCQALMWRTALDVAQAETAVILELGLTRADDRAQWAGRADAAGLGVRLHWVDAPVDERWRRVEGRNAGGGPLAFPVTRELFDWMEAQWQAPDADELARFDWVRVG